MTEQGSGPLETPQAVLARIAGAIPQPVSRIAELLSLQLASLSRREVRDTVS
jgi:hypothetical protein